MKNGILMFAGLVFLAGCAAPTTREQWAAELRKSNRTMEATLEDLEKIPREVERTALLEQYIQANPDFKIFAEIKLLEPGCSDAEAEAYLTALQRAWRKCQGPAFFLDDPLMSFFLEDIGREHVRILKKVADVEAKEFQMQLSRGGRKWSPPVFSQILKKIMQGMEPENYMELLREDISWLQYFPPSCRERALPVVRKILEERNDYEAYYFLNVSSLLLDSPENIERLKLVAIRKPRASFLLPVLAEMDAGDNPLAAEAWEYQKRLPQEERIRSLFAFSALGNREALEQALEQYDVPENRIHLMGIPWLFSPRMPENRKPEELKAYYEEFRDDWSYNPLLKKYERNEFKKKEEAK